MNKRARDRVRCLALGAGVALASASAAAVVLRAVIGQAVPQTMLAVALGASWLCLVLLGLFWHPEPAAPTAPTAAAAVAGTEDRDVDPSSGLPRYDPARDDAHVERDTFRPWAALVVDVDGHALAPALDPSAGAAALADAADRIAAVAAPYGATIRQLHGQQIAILVSGLPETAVTALAAALHDPPRWHDAPHHPAVRLMVGIAVAEPGGGDVAEVVRSASTAATQARRLSTAAPVHFHHRLAEEARARLVVGRALRSAIDEGDIEVVYQPQVDLIDGSLIGVEVLARWHDSVLGPIGPDRFVRIAGELGLSGQLDRLVFDKALSQLAAWDAAGVHVPRICVNITTETITSGRVIGVADMLAAYGIAPDRVSAEILESPALAGQVGREAVQRLRDIGVRVVIDDFGAGQSSFSQLVALPVTGLKIDRSLLSDHDADPAVLGAIIQAGTALGLAVKAVGIETVEQRDLLRGLGCAVGQGYLFARPLSAAGLIEWLRMPAPVG